MLIKLSVLVNMFWTSCVYFVCFCAVARTQVIPGKSRANDGEYNTVNTDGSFDFGYSVKDAGSSYHLAHGNQNGVVGGRFGANDPATNAIKETIYTAGPRGFRPKGPNIHRQLDLDQRPRPVGNKDDPFFDPNEDPSYNYKFETRTYTKSENADARGDVKGTYTFIDDIGERHDVTYIAGRDTGFHVSSAHPDNPNVIGSPFHRAPLVKSETRPRGRTAVQRGLDGSYRFISAGPDQRRSESSDSKGNVRGSYTFLDDKGVQRTVNYIAGPGIGYRIVKNSQDPAIPFNFPTIPSPYDPEFVGSGTGYSKGSGSSGGGSSPNSGPTDDVFKGPDGTAASGHVKPPPFPSNDKPANPPSNSSPTTDDNSSYPPSDNSGYPASDNSGYPASDNSGYPPSFNPGGNQEVGYVDEDASNYGAKPAIGPGKPARPSSKPYRPQKKPYVPLKPYQINRDDDEYSFETGKDRNPQFALGFNINKNRPSATVIRNNGQEYFGVPPGVSVRAHVQSIDLYPFGSKPISPSEAFENDET